MNTLKTLVLHLRRARRDDSGVLAGALALALPALLGMVAVAVDASAWFGERARLQAATDATAIATAREMRLAGTGDGRLLEAAATANARDAAAARGFDPASVAVDVDVDMDAYVVTVTIETSRPATLSGLVDDAFSKISVTASARMTGSAPICVIGLEEREPVAIWLTLLARLDATGCAVYSNSRHRQGLRIGLGARINAALICSGGGSEGPLSSFSPQPRTDCPPIPDPLEARPAPSVGACTHHDVEIMSDTSLSPGVYCGGITVRNGARVRLQSGLYVMKDGPLHVADGALVGSYTSFYFTGDAAVVVFERDSTIDLTAMRDGALAGILFFEDRAAPAGRDFRIASNDARTLLGTIYLSRGNLLVNSERRVADRSAYTIIVARRMILTAGPILTLNTDYGATDVPVPDGVGPTGDIFLSQ